MSRSDTWATYQERVRQFRTAYGDHTEGVTLPLPVSWGSDHPHDILMRAYRKMRTGSKKVPVSREVLEDEIFQIADQHGLTTYPEDSFEEAFCFYADRKAYEARRRGEATKLLKPDGASSSSTDEPNARKSWKTSTILQLAQLYARYIYGDRDAQRHFAALPHSQNALFVQFVVTAMIPFVHQAGMTAPQVSTAWRNLKKKMAPLDIK